jgi:site-specific DNA recombinase
MRVAAPIRVSTDEQAEKGNSLTEQKERLTAYCVAMGWTEPVFFIDDGYSAKNLNRPGIKALLARVKKKEFDIVLTTKIDRFSRNLLDLLQTIRLLDEYDCTYVSSSEKFDTSTAVGRMTLQLLGTFAEFERERTSERVKDNMMSLARNTDRVITLPCYGYEVGEGKFIIKEEEAQNVRYMFELGELGHGHRMIAKLLNEKGVFTKRGKLWDQINVKRLMSTETLTGVMTYNKRQTKNGKISIRDEKDWIVKEDNHPAIIHSELYLKVQEIFRSRSRARKHADNETYLLTGIAKCKYCGGNMKGTTSRHKTKYNEYTYHRYICSSYVLGYGCKHHAVHRDDLENHIISEIKALQATPENTVQIKIGRPQSVESDISDIKEQLLKVNKRMQKQIEAYENDLISADDLKQARQRVESERESLQVKLDKMEQQNGDPSTVKQRIEKLMKEITGDDRLNAKKAFRLLIDNIIVENQIVDITWKD